MDGPQDGDTVEIPPPTPPNRERPRPLSAQVEVEFGARSDPGKVRSNNEDHYLVARYSRSMLPLLTNIADPEMGERFDEIGHCLVVADGIGGTSAGEVASSLAIMTGVNLSLHNPHWGLTITEEEAQKLMRRLRDRMQEVGHVLSRRAHSDPALAGMGTTLTGAYSVGADLFLCHVGDSRAYYFRKGHLHQLTHDHTLAQELADAGEIAPEEVRAHRLRHVLTSALGGEGGAVKTEMQHLGLEDGDWLLLCTDGLYEMVPDDRIADVLLRAGGAPAACDALVELALENGGKDNVTVILARYVIPQRAAEQAEKRGDS